MSGTGLIRDYCRHVVLSPLAIERTPRKPQEQSKIRRIQGEEEGDSMRRGGDLKAQVGVEKEGGQAEEPVAAFRRGYSSAARLLRCRDCNRVFFGGRRFYRNPSNPFER